MVAHLENHVGGLFQPPGFGEFLDHAPHDLLGFLQIPIRDEGVGGCDVELEVVLELGLGDCPVEEGEGGHRSIGGGEGGDGGHGLVRGDDGEMERLKGAVAIFKGLGDKRAESGEGELGGESLGEMAAKEEFWWEGGREDEASEEWHV